MFQFTQQLPLALYIHIPWCVSKCPYCDFNSHELKDELPEQEYIRALTRDLESELPRIWGRKINSVFFGGGTPSLFSPAGIDTLLATLRALLNVSPNTEVTLEANPGTIEQGRFREFRAAGINRLSIGIQSFNDAQLNALGRIHSGKEAERAVEQAATSGFENFNLDLMYGLPGQSEKSALHDLQTAIALEPSHISHYQLTIEPNTAFHRHTPELPDEDEIYSSQLLCQQLLAEHDYRHYEVSAYAKAGHECRHNLNYWQFGDYLGIGAGAHDKITNVAAQSIVRRWKLKHPRQFIESAGTPTCVGGEKTLSRQDAAFEFMLNALRLQEGMDSSLFGERTGLAITEIADLLETAEQKGWIEWTASRITPTETGHRFLNDLLGLFLRDDIESIGTSSENS